MTKPKPATMARKIKEPKPTSNKPPEFQLSGILLEDGSKKAYLKGESLGMGRWVSNGEIVDEWKVLIIGKHSVTLSKQEVSHKLELYVNIGDN